MTDKQLTLFQKISLICVIINMTINIARFGLFVPRYFNEQQKITSPEHCYCLSKVARESKTFK